MVHILIIVIIMVLMESGLVQLTACITRAPDVIHLHSTTNSKILRHTSERSTNRCKGRVKNRWRPRYRMVHWIIWRCIARWGQIHA
ncbi:uncharacterized protein EDB91DRAFT_1161364 [Suillus paluster]|uniref:uncharacterized protein n=1 Tax=Suillus paluster TaxID=48578 RepID=UPI001B86725F|nr:uncharacterized protein EDB91DRAFT_1188930 [Suillus paluster]XP_041168392.1 uncharacterized protein EDB91DRAFT_1186914 [Suillus paluster]XP_041172301.1 uncharacterized protein EDB91DRAFT_1161364 [Suillus paluster]KAG1717770.1 hypothetical protein EDB91DRAFT_1188930 [Suillus paluster]KAG1718118.1 hypothetical protein EDB91DRAFT_1186914 [Suillus paluster]KAG1728626.1 hypothetical protein EDB91DRAFT_1161364 [Suillus paluster]